MKHTLLILCLIFSASQIKAQVFGNTTGTDNGGYNANQIVFFKIETGPGDSGVFTHLGHYNHPTYNGDCDVKMALYDDHPTFDRPNNLLAGSYFPAPINGVFNEDALNVTPAILPSTTYWIGLRVPCSYGTGRVSGSNWPIQPLRYYDSYDFVSNWPDPANPPSSWGAVQLVSLWAIGNNMTVPAELVRFEVENKLNKAAISWSVASEINNEGWNIQRSLNGFTWNTIGHVEGSENHSEEREYSYMDRYEKGGRVFYRLEQVDYDGTKSYSEVRVMLYSNTGLSVGPTLARDFIQIFGLESKQQYSIFDQKGSLLREGTIYPDEQINTIDLQQGSYFIMTENEYFRFVKM